MKVALDASGMTVEAARVCARDRDEWRSKVDEFAAHWPGVLFGSFIRALISHKNLFCLGLGRVVSPREWDTRDDACEPLCR